MEMFVDAALMLSAENKALKLLCGVLLAHAPEARDSLELLRPHLRDLLLAQPLSDQQMEVIEATLAQVAEHAATLHRLPGHE